MDSSTIGLLFSVFVILGLIVLIIHKYSIDAGLVAPTVFVPGFTGTTDVPSTVTGAFKSTCSYNVNGNIISGNCQNTAGGLNLSSLDYTTCDYSSNKGVSNVNGVLTCDSVLPTFKSGNTGTTQLPSTVTGAFQNTCNYSLTGNTISGNCQNSSGAVIASSLDYTTCDYTNGKGVSNVNGVLTCDSVLQTTQNTSNSQNTSSGQTTQNTSNSQNTSSGQTTQNTLSGQTTQNTSSGQTTQNTSKYVPKIPSSRSNYVPYGPKYPPGSTSGQTTQNTSKYVPKIPSSRSNYVPYGPKYPPGSTSGQTTQNTSNSQNNVTTMFTTNSTLGINQSATFGNYTLVLQGDNNLVLNDNTNPNSVSIVWNSNTVNSGASKLMLQNDNNLVLSNASGNAVWDSKTSNQGALPSLSKPSSLNVSNGHLQIIDNTGAVIWNS